MLATTTFVRSAFCWYSRGECASARAPCSSSFRSPCFRWSEQDRSPSGYHAVRSRSGRGPRRSQRRVSSPSAAPRSADRVRAVEVRLAGVAPLGGGAGAGVRGDAAVVDRAGRVAVGSAPEAVAARVPLADSPVVQAALAGNLGALSFAGVDHV